jgi:hypothetical protein
MSKRPETIGVISPLTQEDVERDRKRAIAVLNALFDSVRYTPKGIAVNPPVVKAGVADLKLSSLATERTVRVIVATSLNIEVIPTIEDVVQSYSEHVTYEKDR